MKYLKNFKVSSSPVKIKNILFIILTDTSNSKQNTAK